MTDGPLVVGRWTIPESEIEESFRTSGGPGGQHANRTETAVRLRFDVTASSTLPDEVKQRIISRAGEVIEVQASEERSQLRNRETARRRLVERLEAAMARPRRRRRTKPTPGARERRLAAKRERAETKRRRRKPKPGDWT
ncbi:MAG: aminoacyl-tRNA hydrolase [Actinobacteria bacterium]|nr:aminoacyl-tRNA hydrolase [Actinomycetota bacterium]